MSRSSANEGEVKGGVAEAVLESTDQASAEKTFLPQPGEPQSLLGARVPGSANPRTGPPE